MAFLNRVSGVLRQTTSKHMPMELSASNTSLFQAIRSMSSKLFVGGLSYGTDDMSLREAFSQHGEVVEARIIMDRDTGRSRGFGFVTFSSSEEASSAIGALDGQELHGRRIKVNHATEKPRGGGFRGDFGAVGGGYGGYANNNYGGSGGYGNNNYRGAEGYGGGGHGGSAGGYPNTNTYGGSPGGGFGNNNYGGQPSYNNNYDSSSNMSNHDNVTSGFSGPYGSGAGGDTPTPTPTGGYFDSGIDGGTISDAVASFYGQSRTASGNQN